MPAVFVISGLIGLMALAIYNRIQSAGGLSAVIDTMTTSNDITAPDGDSSNDPLAIALPLIQRFETFSAHAYEDPVGSGKYSIGWGHSIRPGESYGPDSIIGKNEADDLLRIDAGAAWTCVYQNVKVSCSPTQYAALISFVYNEGCTAFKSSTLLRDLNNGDQQGAADEFLNWNKEHINGVLVESADLNTRREQEQALFQSGISA